MNLRRYFLMFIICVSSFMIYTNNVKATTYPAYKHFTDNYIICSSGYSYCDETLNIFTNRGTHNGTILFTFISDPQLILNSVSLVNSNESYYPCELGTQIVYSDNTTGYTLYTATCPIYINDGGVSKIRFKYDDSYLNQNSFKFTMSDYYSFTFDANDIDYSTILNQINSSINSLNTALGGKLDDTNGIVKNIYQKITLVDGKLGTISGQITAVNGKLDNINNNSSATASNTQEIKDKINDSSIDNDSASSSASGWASKNASNGTITQLLTLPISLLTNITNSINSSCSSFSLGTLFDTELVLPCINLQDYLGSALVSIIDILFSGFMIYNIAKKLIKIFNDFTNLKSNQIDEIYGGGNE